jgi:hypothetical protein
MALFVDGPACTIADLTDQDAGLLDVALSTGINVTTKMRLAVDEIQTDLRFWLARPKPAVEQVWGPVLRIEQVVATPVLKRWETMHSLALVYRDAYFSQLVDRYQAKWQEFTALARETRESLLAEGVGIVNDPLKQATPPTLGTTPGPQSGGTFYSSVAWVNATNQEGAPSVAASITITDGNLMTVSTSGTPANAIGFNVYAGGDLTKMFRQNDVPVPVAGSYLYVPGQRTDGVLPSEGQRPDFMRLLSRTILRG